MDESLKYEHKYTHLIIADIANHTIDETWLHRQIEEHNVARDAGTPDYDAEYHASLVEARWTLNVQSKTEDILASVRSVLYDVMSLRAVLRITESMPEPSESDKLHMTALREAIRRLKEK